MHRIDYDICWPNQWVYKIEHYLLNICSFIVSLHNCCTV